MGVSFKGWGSDRYMRIVSPFAPALALVAVQLVWFGMPMGAWIRGIVLGLLTALLAMGMALVYRANRVVNFAQADLGFVPTTLAVGLILFSGLPYLLGFGIGLSAAIALGAVVEFALVRRFAKASRLVLTVAEVDAKRIGAGAEQAADHFQVAARGAQRGENLDLAAARFELCGHAAAPYGRASRQHNV